MRRQMPVVLLLCALATSMEAAPQRQPEPAGEALYKEHCASCHEAGVSRAAPRAALARLSPDNIRFALTKGSMTAQASKLTQQELDILVRLLAAPAGSGDG